MIIQTCIVKRVLDGSSSEIEAAIQASVSTFTIVNWRIAKIIGGLAYIEVTVR